MASLSGGDFNALFRPLTKRAHILQFDQDKADLDEAGQKLADTAWSDQRGASFFFVVSRASTDGAADFNEGLSRDRAKAVLTHLQEKFKDEDLKNQVGLLWLGEQYAQLGDEFCNWTRSRSGCCRAIRTTSGISFWRSAPAPAAMNRRCSRATCSGCMRALPSAIAGRLR